MKIQIKTAEDYVIIGDGIEVPSNGNIIKTKPGSRSKGRENRTKNIRKKIRERNQISKMRIGYRYNC